MIKAKIKHYILVNFCAQKYRGISKSNEARFQKKDTLDINDANG